MCTSVLEVPLGCSHETLSLGHGEDVDSVNTPNLSILTRLQSSIGSALSRSNGATECFIGGSQSDGRVEVLLGGDSAGAVTVALGSGTIAIENQYF